ncbi:MAG: hypothetical protein R3A47_08375 [Polyangiales bacterium]
MTSVPITLRELAAIAMREHVGEFPAGNVLRVTLDVEADDRTEMVSISLKDDSLVVVSSDGNPDGPHAQVALSLVAGIAPTPLLSGRGSIMPAPIVTKTEASLPKSDRITDLGNSLEELVVAITRVGMRNASTSATVQDGLDRFVSLLPKPTPIGSARWIGRVRSAIQQDDATTLARLLDGAMRLCAELREGRQGADSHERIAGFLGVRFAEQRKHTTLSDCTLVEVGREWMTAIDRYQLERRYLVDAESGQLYCEERLRERKRRLDPARDSFVWVSPKSKSVQHLQKFACCNTRFNRRCQLRYGIT